jgi:hypothetical protein
MTCSSSSRRFTRAVLVGMVGLALGAACSGESGAPPAPPGDDGSVIGVKFTFTPASVSFGEVLLGSQSDATVLTVKNIGLDTSATPVVASSDGKTFKIISNTCVAAVASQQSCTVSVAFAPDAAGPKTGTIDISYNGKKDSASVNGTGVQPASLSVTPVSQNFGDVAVGQESKEITFTVKNEGGRQAARPTVVPSDGFALKSNACAAAMNLPAGGMCTVGVVFSPAAAGTKSGTLTASITGSTTTSVLTGRGVAAGSPTFGPSTADFGSIVVGKTSAAQVLKVTNNGGTALAGISVAVANSADFKADSKCTATLEAHASCDVSVTFTPASAGAHAASLILSFTGGSAVGALSGIGLAPARLVAIPSSLDFGAVATAAKSGALTVTVRNAGDEEAAGVTAALDGTGKDQFSISSSCEPTLAGGKMCSIAVTFAPTKEGDASANLVVSGTPGSSSTVSLSGKGVAPGALSITPNPVAFGTINVGSSSGQTTFTVTNSGDVKTGAVKIDRLGNDAADFTIDSDGCTTFEIAPKASCSVVVRFAPGSAGVKNASLNATATPGGITSSLLSGIGVPAAHLSIAPNKGDFGRVPLNQKSDVVGFIVTNDGGAGTGAVSVDTGSTLFKKLALTDTCSGKSLAPLGTCSFEVQFEPAAVGDAKSTLTASAAPGGTSAPVPLTGAGVSPSDIIFTEGTSSAAIFLLDFSEVPAPGPVAVLTRRQLGQTVGTQSASHTVFVRNNGQTATGLLTTKLAGTNLADFVIVSNACTGSLDPGAQCSMALAFKPTVAGDLEAAVDVSAAAGGTASLALRGVGLALLEIVHVTEGSEDLVTSFDFGSWPAGKLGSGVETFRVRARVNTSTVNAALVGETPKNFVKGLGDDGSGFDHCTNAILDPTGESMFEGDTCDIGIEFLPQHEGKLTGTLNVTTSAGQSASLALSGTGTGALSVTPTVLNFGNVSIGGTDEHTFTFRNEGPNTMTSLAISLSTTAEYAILEDQCPAALANGGGLTAGEPCDVTVRFVPAEPGAKPVTLTGVGTFLVGGSPTTATAVATITGTAVAGPVLTVTPATPTFATTAVGNSSGIVTFTVSNGAGSPATGKIKVSGSPSLLGTAEFKLLRNGCVALNQQLSEPGLPLGPGASCTFDIRFDPRDVGTRTTTMFVQAVQGPGGTVTIPLSGIGTPTLTLSPTTVDLNANNTVNVIGSPSNPSFDVTITNNANYTTPVGVVISLTDALGVIPGARAGDEVFFAVLPNTCSTIASGASCVVKVKMSDAPGGVGLHKAILHVTGTAPGGAPPSNNPTAQLTGRLTPDAFIVADLNNEFNADFGTVPVNTSSSKKVLTITNTGGVTSGPFLGSVTNSTEIAFAGDCVAAGPGKTLAPQASCNFELTYSPTVAGPSVLFGVNFKVTVTGAGATVITKALAGNKSAGTQPFITPTPFFFGTVTAGAATGVTHDFTLFNPINAARAVFLQAPVSADWTFTGTGTSPCTIGGADALSNSLVANGNCTFKAVFKPISGSGPSSEKVQFCTVVDGGTDCTPGTADYGFAQLHGLIGSIPTLVIEEPIDGGDFGDVVVTNVAGGFRTFTVRNTGNETSAIVDVSLDLRSDTVSGEHGFGGGVVDSGDADKSSFSIDASGCAKTLAPKGQPGDSCTVSVGVKPTSTGGKKAKLVATAAGATAPDTESVADLGNPLAIRVTGVFDTVIDVVNTYGVTGGGALNTTAINFGNVPVGAEVQRFVEIAVQANDLTASTLTYTLVDGTNFKVVSNPTASPGGALPTGIQTCFAALNAGGLEAGDHCILGVVFRPQALPAATVTAPNMSSKLTILAQSGTSGSLNITGNAIGALRLEAPEGTPITTTVTLPTTGAGQVSAVQELFARNQTVANALSDPPTTGQLAVKVEGANASDFRTVLNECIGITVDADDTCEIDLRFEPSTAGAKTAKITVSGSPGNSASANLAGTAN